MVERQSLSLDLEEVEPLRLVHKLVNDYQGEATGKGLELVPAVTAGTPSVQTSPEYLEDIITNLSTNALKYTETARITVGAYPSSRVSCSASPTPGSGSVQPTSPESSTSIGWDDSARNEIDRSLRWRVPHCFLSRDAGG